MDSVDTEVLKSAVAWLEAGRGGAPAPRGETWGAGGGPGGGAPRLATVVKTWGSAPRPVGAMLVIRDDGHVMGSVSGGCVEDDLIERVKSKALAAEKPEVVVYGVTTEQAARFGLPCGGALQLVLEPVRPESRLREL